MIEYCVDYTPTPFTPEQKDEIARQTPYSEVVLEKMQEYIQRMREIREFVPQNQEADEAKAERQFDTVTKIATLHIVNHHLWGRFHDDLTIPNMNDILMAQLKQKIGQQNLPHLNEIMLEAVRVVKDYYLTGGRNCSQPAQ